MSWGSRCISAVKATTQTIPSPVAATLSPPVIHKHAPHPVPKPPAVYTSNSLAKNRIVGPMSISSGLGVSTQVRCAHTDTIKVPDFSEYRRRSVQDPKSRNKDSAEKRKVFNYVVHSAGAVAGLFAAKHAVRGYLQGFGPSAAAMDAAKVEIKLDGIPEGKSMVAKWRGKPLFIRHRTEPEVKAAEGVDVGSLRDPQTDAARVKDPKWLIVLGVCTHLGCVPIANKGFYNGYYCPCHGSHYDVSGRIRRGPAPLNLEVPPYEFKSSSLVVVG